MTLEVLGSSSPLALEIDGVERADIGPGHRLCIAQSHVTARLVHVGHAGFAARARSKLQLRDSPELA